MLKKSDEKTNGNLLISLMALCYIAGTYILITFSWGRYVVLASVMFLLFFYFTISGEINVNLSDPYLICGLSFIFICFCSVLWAEDKSAALTKSVTILEVFICSYVIYLVFSNLEDFDGLYFIILIAGYCEALFLLLYYGGDVINSLAAGGERMSNEVGNANFIGMLMATNITLTLYYVLFERVKWVHLLSLLSVYILILSQSRTAILGCILSVALLIFVRIRNSENFLKKFLILISVLILGSVILLYLFRSGVLNASISRLDQLFSVVSGEEMDGSSKMRISMIKEGWKQFLKTPILGLGISNSYLVTEIALGRKAYLHNNFIEMLVSLGFVGFMAYYSFFIYAIVNLIKYRNYKTTKFYFCITMICMLLLMDMGTVPYYKKETYIYFAVIFLEINHLKKNKEGDET